jgi:hypothetical protein
MRAWSSEVASRHSEVFPYPDTADATNIAARPAAATAPSTFAFRSAGEAVAAAIPIASTAKRPPSTTSVVGRVLLLVQVK